MAWRNLFDRLLKALSLRKRPKNDGTAEMDSIRVHLGPMPEMVRTIIKDLEEPEPKKP